MGAVLRTAVSVTALLAAASPAMAVKFQFRPEPGMAPEAVAAFQAAGKLWEDQLSDDITIVIDIDFTQLKPNVLGSTNSEKVHVYYKDFRAALLASEPTAVGLQQSIADTETLDLMINRTNNNPAGAGNAKPYLDNDADDNNQAVWLTRANAKALGLIDPQAPEPDAAIAFSTEMNWDFDPSNGVDQDKFDFIAVAAHEIGHTLGFVSGVDILDANSGEKPDPGPYDDNEFVFVTPADVYRRSAESRAVGPRVVDWAADKRDKTFALRQPKNEDGGFSTGVRLGDGRQASHWKDDLELGLMDPTIAPGVHAGIAPLDLEMFDSIGYERTSQVAAAPTTTTRGLVPQVTNTAEAGTVQQPGQRKFEYSDLPEKPIIELRYSGGMIQNADETPFIRVYGNGTVKIYYPRYTKKAGDYTLQLTPEQLKDITENFSNNTVADTPVLRLDDVPTGTTRSLRSVGPSGPSDVIGDHNVRAEVTLQIERIDPASQGAAPMTNVKRTISLPAEGVKSTTRSLQAPVSGPASGVKQIEGLAADPRLKTTK